MRHKGRIISAKTSKKLSNLKRFTKKEEEESVEENQTAEEFDSQGQCMERGEESDRTRHFD